MSLAFALADQAKAAQHHGRGVFFLAAVSSQSLTGTAELFDSGQLAPNVGEVLPLADTHQAHKRLAGKPHNPGTIVLTMGAYGSGGAAWTADLKTNGRW